jgi:hypothetical protein
MQIPGPNIILGRGNPFQILVALSSTGDASGNLYWDDGDAIGILFPFNNKLFIFRLYNLDSIDKKLYNYFELSAINSVSLMIIKF